MKKMTSFVCENKILLQINLIAKADGKSRSQVLREAVTKYLDDHAENSLAIAQTDPASTDGSH